MARPALHRDRQDNRSRLHVPQLEPAGELAPAGDRGPSPAPPASLMRTHLLHHLFHRDSTAEPCRPDSAPHRQALEAANQAGADLYGQISPSPLNMKFSLASPYPFEGLAAWLPAMQVVDQLPAYTKVLQDPVWRATVRDEIELLKNGPLWPRALFDCHFKKSDPALRSGRCISSTMALYQSILSLECAQNCWSHCD